MQHLNNIQIQPKSLPPQEIKLQELPILNTLFL